MYKCKRCNSINKPDYLFIENVCLDCVSEYEMSLRDEYDNYIENDKEALFFKRYSI